MRMFVVFSVGVLMCLFILGFLTEDQLYYIIEHRLVYVGSGIVAMILAQPIIKGLDEMNTEAKKEARRIKE